MPRGNTLDAMPATEFLAPSSFTLVGEAIPVPSTVQLEAASPEKAIVADAEADAPRYPDGGWRAWGVVFGCFVYSCCQNGYSTSWGVLSASLKAGVHKEVPIGTLNLIIGLQNFAMLAGSLVAGRLGDRLGFKPMIALGTVLTFATLVISAVTYKSLPCLFVFQGAALGLAQSIALPLIMSLPSQWFQRRRGLATGLAVSGTGIGGAVSSLILQAMLPPLGYRSALLVYAGINAGLCCFAFFLLKTRNPQGGTTHRPPPRAWFPKGIWRHVTIYSLLGTFGIGVWGMLVPFYYIIPYTALHCPTIDPSSLKISLPEVLMNLFSGFGRMFIGYAADFLGPVNALFLTFFFGGTLQLLFWPFAKTFGSIVAFSCLYGLLGVGFTSLIPSVAAQLFMDSGDTAGLATICGLCIFALGPGQFVSPTVAGYILSASGGNYLGPTLYSGSVMVVGACALLPGRFTRQRKVFIAY